jgi:hypothetical protein
MWGALTAELARREAECGEANYGIVGETLRSQARMTCLYPAEFSGGCWNAWLPRYASGVGLTWELELGGTRLNERRFRRRLLDTRPSTAIDPNKDVAQETSLHETECLQMHWRSDADETAAREVAMVGYICADADLMKRLNHVDTLFLGGDSRYGLGRVHRIGCPQGESIFDLESEIQGADLYVTGTRVLGPAATSASMIGAREVFGGWDLEKRPSSPGFEGEPLWTPGSVATKAQSWTIDSSGIWRNPEFAS